MIAQILPLLRMPKSLGVFSYTVPLELQKQIKQGQIVKINFRHKTSQGLIVGFQAQKKKISFKLKEIEKIITPEPIITATQIDLINFISDYYGLAKGLVARSLVPMVSKKQYFIKIQKHKNTKTLKHTSTKIILLYWYNDEEQIINLIKEKSKQVLKNKNQILILVPEINLIDKISQGTNLNTNKVVKIHSHLKKTEYFSAWQKILNRESAVIIGTKIAAFLPFKNLEKIIIFKEEDWNHKQSDINPRYDAQEIAKWLAKKYGSELILTTPAPKVETYYFSVIIPAQACPTYRSFELVEISKINAKTFNTRGPCPREADKLVLIDLKQEKLAGNYSLVSDKLLEKIKEKLTFNQKIFLFHNKIGFAKFISCNDCGHVFQCPNCEISLNYEIKNKQLFCSQCNYREDVPPFCPKCSGADIKFKSAGVQKIKSELIKFLPNAKIFTLEKISKNHEFQNYDIIIGTKFALNKIDFKNFNLIAFINFDQLLYISDFRASEKAYQLFYEIMTQNPNADFFIQTNGLENHVIKSISQNNPNIFYNEELKLRQNFEYPPFCQLIKLTAQHKKEKEAKIILKKTESLLKKQWPELEILGPIANIPHKLRGNYKYHLILKISNNFSLKKILTIIPDNIIIDVNPEKLT